MSKKPSPREDELRRMREANYEAAQKANREQRRIVVKKKPRAKAKAEHESQ